MWRYNTDDGTVFLDIEALSTGAGGCGHGFQEASETGSFQAARSARWRLSGSAQAR